MDAEAQARVERLVEWCKKYRVATTPDGSEFLPKAFAVKMAEAGVKGRDTYWMGVVGKADRSFGAKKAREVEQALRMPPFYLDGGAPAPSPDLLRLLDLNQSEMTLIMLYRLMNPDSQHALLVEANKLHNLEHPGPSPAHPFPDAPPPGVEKAKKERK